MLVWQGLYVTGVDARTSGSKAPYKECTEGPKFKQSSIQDTWNSARVVPEAERLYRISAGIHMPLGRNRIGAFYSGAYPVCKKGCFALHPRIPREYAFFWRKKENLPPPDSTFECPAYKLFHSFCKRAGKESEVAPGKYQVFPRSSLENTKGRVKTD